MKAPPRIEQIVATKFRGATRRSPLKFDPKKGFVLIFGENGTGKSTIIDAIDMVCNKYPGSIKDRSSIRIAEHLPSIGSKPSDVSVELTVAGTTWKASMSGASIRVTPSSDLPSATILRRRKILALVEATPSERFDQLKTFIDVENVQKCEEELKKAVRETERNAQERTRELATAEQNLKRAYEEDHSPDETGLTPETWARRRIDKSLDQIQKTVAQYKAIIDACQAAFTVKGTTERHQEDLDGKRTKKEEVKKKIDDAGALDASTGIILVDLLEKVGAYLKKADKAEECPVCLQPVQHAELSRDIATRLSSMEDLVTLAKQWQQVQTGVLTAQAQTGESYRNLITNVAPLVELVAALPASITSGANIEKAKFPDLSAWPGDLTKEVIDEAKTFMANVAAVVETVKKEHESLTTQLAQLNAVKRDHDAALRAREEAEQQLQLKKVLQSMYELARRTRIQFTQTILDAVADECDRLYARIHPDEPLGGVRFALDEEKRGSLHQSGRFGDHDGIVPQAYFSDSHLDTLGFCFFVAVAKYTTGGRTTLIIDDVFTSVDLSHIKRILHLLLDEAASYHQIILATHQRRWLDLFQTNQAPAHQAAIIRLRPWTLDTGICGDAVTTYIDQLQMALTAMPMNRREISALSGFLIESILGEMTKYLNCSIKRSPKDRYTAYDLLCSMRTPSKALTVTQAPPDDSSDQDALVKHDAPALHGIVSALCETLNDVRNTVGDHFNWDAADIPDETVRQFGENSARMAQMLTCAHCGAMATRTKSSLLQCPCGRLSLLRN